MSNRKHFHAISQFLEHEVIGKSGHGQSTRFAAHEWNTGPRGRESLNQFKSSLHFANEPISNLRIPFAVPSRRVAKLPRAAG